VTATYIIIYIGSALVALAATPVIARLARAIGLVDKPGVRKVHVSAVPRVGGVVIMLAMLATTLPVLLANSDLAEEMARPPAQAGDEQAIGTTPISEYTPAQMQTHVLLLLAASVFIGLVGLVDDVRSLPAIYKLTGQIVAAAALCWADIRIERIVLSAEVTIEFGVLSWPITILWIVGITNAVNLIDGLDGLAAGISAITCGVIAVFSLITGQVVMTVLMLGLLGSLTGFLVFNFNPAKIFLGDSGSMFLGFLLAAASVLSATKTYAVVALAMPLLALGLPIFDTLFSMMRRALNRRSLMSPDRGHIHHRLIDMGLEHRQAVIVMYAVTAAAAGLGLLMIFTRNIGIVLVLVVALIPIIAVFRMVGAVRFRQAVDALQQNRALARQDRRHQKGFEEMLLRLQEARTFDQWWRALRRSARRLGFVRMSLVIDDPSVPTSRHAWRSVTKELQTVRTLHVALPRIEHADGRLMTIELDVPADETLEAASRTLTWFSRLLDDDQLREILAGAEETHDAAAPAQGG
jgi:UDP-GlcNAc:undecaprenyl-phosphate GlcNAc-1-phosphate transferase